MPEPDATASPNDPAPNDAAPTAPTGGRPVGAHYRAHELLGSGAMGEVRRGESSTGEQVAVKLLHPALAGTPGLVARFVNERSVLTGLSGPHLVHVRDLVVDGSTLAIVMDLVAGGDLRRHLAASGTLPPAEAAALVAGVLTGLETVHRAGVVHRDVKPENVLLDRPAGDGPLVPKVADFGVSKITTGLSSGRTSIIGTPVYMAPELLDGEPTPGSDLYAVGVMLYELLCGVPPFASGNPLTLMRLHAEAVPGRPPGVPDALWAVLLALLAKDPAARPPSAGAVAAHLHGLVPALAGVPAAERLSSPPAPDAESATLLTSRAASRSLPAAAVPAQRAPRRRALIGTAVVTALALAGGGTALALAGQGDEPDQTAAPAAVSEPVATEPSPSPTATPSAEPSASPSGSPSASPAASSSASPASGALPDLVGMPLKEAVAELAARGLQYDVEDVAGSGRPEGTVVRVTAATGVGAGQRTVLGVARSVLRTYLADVAAVDGSLVAGVVSISGQQYTHGLADEFYSCPGQASSTAYDLGRQSSRLTGVAGLTDDSASGYAVQLEVLGDDRVLTKVPLSLGKPQTLDVDVTGVLRLVLRYTPTACGDGRVDTSLALGDVALLGLPNSSG